MNHSAPSEAPRVARSWPHWVAFAAIYLPCCAWWVLWRSWLTACLVLLYYMGAFAIVSLLQLRKDSGPGLNRANRKPNIVFILADDLGYGGVGCYGQKKYQTPNIDCLAAEGMRFTHMHAGSHVCAPSRCTLMTGLHTGHAPVRANGKNRYLYEG